ncbi:hypothetical protein TMatcc_000184 [Talaromyces marneffei ATCC 18224]
MQLCERDRTCVLHHEIGPVNLLVASTRASEESRLKNRASGWLLIDINVEEFLLQELRQAGHVFHAEKCFDIALHDSDAKAENSARQTFFKDEIVDAKY